MYFKPNSLAKVVRRAMAPGGSHYFGKHVEEPTLRMAAPFAGNFPRSPNLTIHQQPCRAKLRPKPALQSLWNLNYISKADIDEDAQQPITVFRSRSVVAAYFC